MDTELDAWQNQHAQAKLRSIATTYEPGMPQTCRLPGSLWFFAIMLTGDMDRLRDVIKATVDTCRATPGYEWELAAALQWRANLLANRSDWAGDAIQDAEEALEIYERIGDLWGTAEALSARAEAHERRGEWRAAADDYERAIERAEQLGARAQRSVLNARLGSTLLETGEPGAAERGELLLREVIADQDGARNEAMPASRMFLAGRLGMTGRIPEAREQLRLLRQQFGIAHFVIFDAFILGSEAWLEAVDGCYEESLRLTRRALEKSKDPLALTIAPHMRTLYLHTAGLALAGADGGARALDGARCLAAGDALLPAAHAPTSIERTLRSKAERDLRAVLGDVAYESAYTEGGGLSPEEAAALV